MEIPRLNQSDGLFITVGRDYRGSVVWLAVAPGQIVECVSGHRAVAVLQAMAQSRGLSVPQ